MKNLLPENIPVFPLSGVIFFPKTNLPLNIFEPRYLTLVSDCYKSNKYMGMIQAKKNSSDVYSIGCLGKITEQKKTKEILLKTYLPFYSSKSKITKKRSKIKDNDRYNENYLERKLEIQNCREKMNKKSLKTATGPSLGLCGHQ